VTNAYDANGNTLSDPDLLPVSDTRENTTESFEPIERSKSNREQFWWTVDDFLAVEAPKLNRDQQIVRRWLQSLQHQPLAVYRVQ